MGRNILKFCFVASPKVLPFAQDYEVLRSTDFEVSCNFDESVYPKPSVTWYKQNNDDGREIVIQGQLLKLNSVSVNDGGIYTCEVANKVGSASQDLALEILYAPNIEQQFNDTQISEFSNLKVDCLATGNPTPKVQKNQ